MGVGVMRMSWSTTTLLLCSQSHNPTTILFRRPPSFSFRDTTRRRQRSIHLRARRAAATEAQLDDDDHSGIMWKQLQKGIAEFYDESSTLWENIWGDHMHHGFYDPDSSVSLSDHRPAQIRMIDEALRFASLPEEPKNVVDVGCGIGGSSRYIASKYGAKCKGITLSPVQAQRANALASSQSLSPQVSFQVADALDQPFADGKFDLVWSMESGEHMPDKSKFVSELARVAAPGGTIIIVTWCHRDLKPGEESLQPWEQTLLNKICDAFYLPAWCSTADYVRLMESLSLQDIKAADWSQYVAPFWPAVIRSALTWKGLTSLLRAGRKTIRGALAMPLMIEGYKKDLIKFAIITCRKPHQ
ncbi:Tocopherol O-methyltransferase [Morus notabilis]|uniref:Tocopherol O-methyltransferase n=1 Tax=Morus notabilis TaxID=981085 RepID=W9QYI3_9ROSA|nr:tocopherol O-methyltransferase, chloroplastic [Morus notabilis]EXB29127.1 Tocopherol O-methyltransferase [Morus notabilis]